MDLNFSGIYDSQMDIAKPIHIQRLESSLDVGPYLSYAKNLLTQSLSDSEDDSDSDFQEVPEDLIYGDKLVHDVVTTKEERRSDKFRLYNFANVGRERQWLQETLISDSDSSDSEIDYYESTHEYIQELLKMHVKRKNIQAKFQNSSKSHRYHRYQYYSSGLLSNYDRYSEHQKLNVKVKRRKRKQEKKIIKIKESKFNAYHDDNEEDFSYEMHRNKNLLHSNFNEESPYNELDYPLYSGHIDIKPGSSKTKRKGQMAKTPEFMAAKRRKMWQMMAKKELGKVQRSKVNNHKEYLTSCKRLASVCMKVCRQRAMLSQKVLKENVWRAKRLTREMQAYWKRYDRVERETKRRMEKEAEEQRKMDVELIEAKRQQRKLNFLITQTELYAHFMSKKLGKVSAEEQLRILSQLDEETNPRLAAMDDYDCELMKQKAKKNAQAAFLSEQSRTKKFDNSASTALSNPLDSNLEEQPQPTIFQGNLKGYQLKGMTWLANLYDQGISGILADEMGLGKTVQSIAFLCHVAERYGLWGPFLIISPASTLHNWQQEMARFVPDFTVVPYWGSPHERKILRQFWNQKGLHTKEASFHVVITSYQLVISDYKYFNRIKWQYMILDEAQAIKSSSSVRWKLLLGFNCRNRLLLSGTPIQNSMAELWALLHFIMPTLFDSHDEFNEWFSKDIESHAENKTGIDEKHLSRLHMILKPFMLRRIKKDVENELSDKIEIMVYCPLTTRQKLLYIALRQKIQIEDLLHYTIGGDSGQLVDKNFTSNLMNLVMQFRKVCNHPELFERRDARSPFAMKLEDYVIPVLIYNDGLIKHSFPSKRHLLYNKLNIFTPSNVFASLNELSQINDKTMVFSSSSTFSFTRFIDLSYQEVSDVFIGGIIRFWCHWLMKEKKDELLILFKNWSKNIFPVCQRSFLKLYLESPLQSKEAKNNELIKFLIFTSSLATECAIYTYTNHIYHYIQETMEHRIIRSKSQVNYLADPDQANLVPEFIHKERKPKILHCQPTNMPTFVYGLHPKVQTKSRNFYCSNRAAQWAKIRHDQCENLAGLQLVYFGSAPILGCISNTKGGLEAARPAHGWSNIIVPDKQTLVSDAGKLAVLDNLLTRLKADGHRVLIYSQMTKMIDLLEEYMWHRKHKYMRLDGSSKISARRDMVADFQARADIFVFLLSTRAGGLGINLTAADTVIFYDSDWNPTVDQQAMDRAHRLGQTKQVTVYRLICKGTIEERILQRAREKSEIQRMVISGGNFKPESLKPKEVVSLLLDDDELELKYKQKGEEHYDMNKKRKLSAVSKISEVKRRAQTPESGEIASSLPESVPGSPRSDRSGAQTLGSSASSSGYGGETDNIIVDADESARRDESTFAGFSLGFNPRRRHHPRGTKRGRPRGSRRGGGNGTTSTRPVTGMESVEANSELETMPMEPPSTGAYSSEVNASPTSDSAPISNPLSPGSRLLQSSIYRRGPGRPRLKLSGPAHRGLRRPRRPHGPLPVPLGSRFASSPPAVTDSKF